MTNIIISGGRLIDPANNIDQLGSLYISNGKIAAVFEQPDGFTADLTIDAQQKIVCPGFIDLCARLREPGQTHKASIASESQAASSAGITSLCMPPDTKPVIDTSAVTKLILDKATSINKVQVLPIGALTSKLDGATLSNMLTLSQAGCIAFSNARKPIKNTLVLRRAMTYAASNNLLVIIHPEDPWLSNQGCAHEGVMASRYGLPGIPEIAELIAINQAIALAELSGCRLHFAQLSCARSVDIIAQARANKLAITADVAIQQLYFSEADIPAFDSHYHVLPPYRSITDKQCLIAGVANGTIDAICSDHQPHDIDAKLGAFPETEPGISSLQSMLPLALNLVSDNKLSLTQVIALMTHRAAAIIDHPGGTLSVNSMADICIFDPEQSWQVNDDNWFSQGKNTPFWQQTLKGRVTHTLRNGELVYCLHKT